MSVRSNIASGSPGDAVMKIATERPSGAGFTSGCSMWKALYQPMTMREMPYHVAKESSAKRTTFATCSARNHQNANSATLCRPRKTRTPRVHRSHRATGRARRCRKTSESSRHARPEFIRGVVDRHIALDASSECEAVRQRDVRGECGAPWMEGARECVETIARDAAVEVRVERGAGDVPARRGDETRFAK